MYHYFNTSIGYITLTDEDKKLIRVEFGHTCERVLYRDLFLEKCQKQIEEYLAKKRKHFDIPYELKGTKFQKTVWEELAKIPYGTTISYKQLAERIGNVKAVRAVANAVGKNPLPIILPCHRVIGSNGKLVGFTGGLDKKEFLLKLEGVIFKETKN